MAAHQKRGGARPGAGRPRSGRRQRQYRATESEHRLVREFIVGMRKNFEQAQSLVQKMHQFVR